MKKKSGLSYSNFYYYLLLIAPLFLIYIVFFVVPVVSSLFLSMTNYNGLSLDVKFTGLNNYIVAFSDKVFRKAMWNTILFAGLATLLQNGLALLLALGLNAKIKGRGFMRMLVFAPCMISPIITAFVWQFIFMPEGLLNRMLGAVGIGRMDKAWLGSVDTALVCVVCAHVWMWIGYSATIYLSNLSNMSEDITEAARIDGCSRMNLFCYITFPMLAPATTINITLAFTQSLKVFDIVYAMTNGGPLNATETVGTYVIRNMGLNLHGYASAMTVLLMFVIILTGTVLIGRLKKREAEIY